jgi:hypothetical protein
MQIGDKFVELVSGLTCEIVKIGPKNVEYAMIYGSRRIVEKGNKNKFLAAFRAVIE